ncbi:BLUF domain-containing protein [Stenotrophomonas sp.]|uniref:BLUF domain-containing protein n=1 Tax=Stenotrophomonas sp. TaxID=69392 RepID=UPI002FC801E5
MTQSSAIHALAYTSRAVGGLTNADLERILVDASITNRAHDVTGALLYDGFRFLQYIEGPEAGLQAVLARIEAARSHAGIEMLVNGPVPERHFWNWSMACRHAQASMIQRLERARWTERAHPHLLDQGEVNEGLALLSAFWQQDPPPPR